MTTIHERFDWTAENVELRDFDELEAKRFDPGEERDEHGRWTSGGGTEFGSLKTMPSEIEGIPIFKKAMGSRVLAIGGTAGINVNTSRAVASIWKDMATYQKKAFVSGWMSSDHPNHTLWHELCHTLVKRTSSSDHESMLTNLNAASNPTFKDIAIQVSRYAATNGHEFLSEVFAGIRGGRTFNEDVMRLYEHLKGPKP